MKRHVWQRRPGVAWAAAGAAAGLAILGAVLVFTAATRSANGRTQIDAPVMTLLPRSTVTELVIPSPTALPTETLPSVPVEDPNSGQIEVGLIVEVYGTEGTGCGCAEIPARPARSSSWPTRARYSLCRTGPWKPTGGPGSTS